MKSLALWSLLASCGCADAAAPVALPTSEAPSPPLALLGAEPLRARLFAEGSRRRVVNFWATWCGPCIEEMPRLAAWGRAHPDVELVFVNVDLPKLRASKVEPFLAERGLVEGVTHLQLDDPDPAMALSRVVAAWPDAIPVTLLLDEKGQEVRRYTAALTDDDLGTWTEGTQRPGWWNR